MQAEDYTQQRARQLRPRERECVSERGRERGREGGGERSAMSLWRKKKEKKTGVGGN